MIRPATAPQLTVPVNERDHILGAMTASVTMVEYGDYECSYCVAHLPWSSNCDS